MKQFFYDGCIWQLSKCEDFVSMLNDEGQSGWFRLSMFTDELQAAAKQAK